MKEPESIRPSGSFILILQPNRNGKATYKVVGFCVIFDWWSIGESNP